MRIVNLIENTEGKSGCLYEHGLSFYVETLNHKLLIDAGAGSAFLSNAQKLGIDLTQVDMVILSHGHYDHSGGILAFTEINPNAKIIMQKTAGGAYYHKNGLLERYIGIDPKILSLPQVEWLKGEKQIDDELFIFAGVPGRKLWPAGNAELKVKKGDCFFQDAFEHEQYLVVKDNNRSVLISGCAHNGILNILDKYREIYGTNPDVVISGFHMRKKSGYTEKELDVVRKTAIALKKTDTKFYTGHCTGEVPYQLMKECMGEQLEYVHSGDEIDLE